MNTIQTKDRPKQIIMHGGGGGACILSFPGLCSTVLFAAG